MFGSIRVRGFDELGIVGQSTSLGVGISQVVDQGSGLHDGAVVREEYVLDTGILVNIFGLGFQFITSELHLIVVVGEASNLVAFVPGKAELEEVGVLIDVLLVDRNLLDTDELHLGFGTILKKMTDFNFAEQTEEMIGHQGERFILFDHVDDTIWTR